MYLFLPYIPVTIQNSQKWGRNSSLKAMLLHTKSVILETLTCVFSKTCTTPVSRIWKNLANKQVACAAPQLSVCVYVLTEISMDTLSQYACMRPTFWVFCANAPNNVEPRLVDRKTKEMLGTCFHPTTSNNVQQVPTTLNRVCKHTRHVR